MFKEVIVEISKNCNLNCIMCGYGAKYNKPHHFMDYALFVEILKALNGNYEVLRLNGRGESTIHPQFIEFVETAGELCPNKRTRLFTNMNYRDAAITKCLAERSCETMISLDSIHKETLEKIRLGVNYERVMKNIDDLCQQSRLTAVVFTMQPRNFGELQEMAEFVLAHNCHFFCNAVRNPEMEKEFRAIVEDNVDSLKETYDNLAGKFAKKKLMLNLPAQIAGVTIRTENAVKTCANCARCPNAGKDLCIYYDGTVTPCGMFNPYELGNIKENTLQEILQGEALAQFIKNQPKDEYCRNCQYIL